MEHRHHPRVLTRFQVGVYHRQRHLGDFEAREVSCEGLFLKNGPEALIPYEVIELRVEEGGDCQEVQGMVIHAGPKGAGVMLDETSQGAILNLMSRGRMLSNQGEHGGGRLSSL